MLGKMHASHLERKWNMNLFVVIDLRKGKESEETSTGNKSNIVLIQWAIFEEAENYFHCIDVLTQRSC